MNVLWTFSIKHKAHPLQLLLKTNLFNADGVTFILKRKGIIWIYHNRNKSAKVFELLQYIYWLHKIYIYVSLICSMLIAYIRFLQTTFQWMPVIGLYFITQLPYTMKSWQCLIHYLLFPVKKLSLSLSSPPPFLKNSLPSPPAPPFC